MADCPSGDLDLRNMPDRPGDGERPRAGRLPTKPVLWGCGIWVLSLTTTTLWFKPATEMARIIVVIVAILVAPLPAFIWSFRQRSHLLDLIADAAEDAVQLKLQLDTVRYRTSRLREELQAADKQARLSHQLTLLGQFTAGFMHEFNNPLAIVAGRIEVLLEERKEDAALCDDLSRCSKKHGTWATSRHASAGAPTRARQ